MIGNEYQQEDGRGAAWAWEAYEKKRESWEVGEIGGKREVSEGRREPGEIGEGGVGGIRKERRRLGARRNRGKERGRRVELGVRGK